MSPAESLGLNRNSFVFPLTRINRRLICKEKGHQFNPITAFFDTKHRKEAAINTIF
jgi:hypothetical protein